MNPASRLGCSLVASLVLWFPTLQACMRGDTDLASASIRYLVAFALATLAVNVLAGLVTGYASQSAEPRAGNPETGLARRRDDVEPLLATEE